MEEIKPKLRETMTLWNAAVAAHTTGRYSDAIEHYSEIKNKSARIFYNMACAHVKLCDIDYAIMCLTNAIENDPLLVIAYFQRGAMHLMQRSTKEAMSDIKKTRALMRGNSFINYKPLGLLCRIHSYQVFHNLAVANVYEGNIAEAEDLLKEALHGADDVQKQLINNTMKFLQNGEIDQIKPALASSDRVFTPPKSITKNLVQKSLLQKAVVVSAVDAEDRYPTFNGIKRVEEIKQQPVKKQLRIPLFAGGRFTKNPVPRDRKLSDAFFMMSPKPLRGSKSMGDIRNLEGFSTTEIDINGNENNEPSRQSISMTHSQSVSSLPLVNQMADQKKEPKSPRTPKIKIKGVKKLFQSKSNSPTSSPVFDGIEPVFTMRGCNSTGDLAKSINSSADSLSATLPSPRSNMSNIHSKIAKNRRGRKHSLGSIFGQNLSAIGQTLALSCDVLTAFATPIETGSDVEDAADCDSSRDSQSSPDDIQTDCGKPSESALFYIEGDCDRNSSLVRRIHSVKPSRDDIYIQHTIKRPKSTNSDVTYDAVTGKSAESNKTEVTVSLPNRKSRPPPPSYPPPSPPPVLVYRL